MLIIIKLKNAIMTRKRIKEIVIDELVGISGMGAEAITDDTHLEKDLGIDSLDAVETIFNLEKVFGITIGDDELTDIKEKTVSDLIDFIETKIS